MIGILFSFCLIGMASAKIIPDSCLNKEGKLEMTCKDSEGGQSSPCIFKADDKVIASTDKTMPDSLYKDKAKASIEEGVCKLVLTDFKDKAISKINCSVGTPPKQASVDIKTEKACSDGSILQYAGVTLLLALLAPLLSEVL